MNSNRSKAVHITASGTTSTPDSQGLGGTAAYPSPPSSPSESKGDVHATDEISGKESCSSVSLPSASAIIPTAPDARQRNETVQLKSSTLKDLFGINSWLCGGLTLNHQRPCRRRIAENLRNQINIHIDTMIMPHHSSLELQAELEKLVDLVHCYQHRRGYARLMRLDTWMDVFPSSPDRPSCATSMKRKIELCFGRLTNQCIGITQENKRCKNHIGGQKVQNRTKTINEISKAEVYVNDLNLDYFLQVLAANMYCRFHTTQSPSKELTLWKERIRDIVERASSIPLGLEGSNYTTGSPGKQDSLEIAPATRNIPTKRKDPLASKVSDKISTPITPLVNSTKSPLTHWPDQYDTTPLDIVKGSDSTDDYKASYNVIRDQMMKTLSAKDQETGYLYIYEVEGNKEFVKIGYTTRSIKERHEEWCFDCNRKPKLLFPGPAMKAPLVPNARRVEALCHAELSHRRVIIFCYGCLKTHQEWFRVSSAEAVAVIEKWSAWMKKEPYKSDKSSLKEKETRKASDMDQFMTDLLTQSK